jgi:hypothetical protein
MVNPATIHNHQASMVSLQQKKERAKHHKKRSNDSPNMNIQALSSLEENKARMIRGLAKLHNKQS